MLLSNMRLTRSSLASSQKGNSSPTVSKTVGMSSPPVKRQSQRLRKIPVKVSTVSQKQFTLPDPVYDQEGKDVTLLEEHPADRIISSTSIQSCKFLLLKSLHMRRELERTLNNELTLGPMGSLRYMAKLIATDRNMMQSIHHLLVAESHRLTVVDPVMLYTRVMSHEEYSTYLATLKNEASQEL